MLIEEVKKITPRERFLYWIRERMQILLKRRSNKIKPWTNDEVLKSYYFTNVRREDDKVTTWFRENIREPLCNSPDIAFATIAFRWFNWPPTGELLLRPFTGEPAGPDYSFFTNWRCEEAVILLNAARDIGRQIFTGAFNISNSGSPKPKINRVCEDYIQPVWEDHERIYKELEGSPMSRAFQVLQRLPGLGGSGFMAAQVICDLAYTHVLQKATDWWTWCSWGPGSKRGMNRVHGCLPGYNMPRAEWHRNLEELRKLIGLKLGLELHARDVQNCLCEFDKYERGLWNEGHLKRRYPGGGKCLS